MLAQIDKGTILIIILLLLIERKRVRGNNIFCLAYWKKGTKPKNANAWVISIIHKNLSKKKKKKKKSLDRSFIGYNIVIIGYITIMISTKYTIHTK